jgi:hypothetical protein
MAMINDATEEKLRQREYKCKERNMNHKMEPVSEGLESQDFPNSRGYICTGTETPTFDVIATYYTVRDVTC